jgi:hypothetical protein
MPALLGFLHSIRRRTLMPVEFSDELQPPYPAVLPNLRDNPCCASESGSSASCCMRIYFPYGR